MTSAGHPLLRWEAVREASRSLETRFARNGAGGGGGGGGSFAILIIAY